MPVYLNKIQYKLNEKVIEIYVFSAKSCYLIEFFGVCSPGLVVCPKHMAVRLKKRLRRLDLSLACLHSSQ